MIILERFRCARNEKTENFSFFRAHHRSEWKQPQRPKSAKSLQEEFDALPIKVPRDRSCRFSSIIIAMGEGLFRGEERVGVRFLNRG